MIISRLPAALGSRRLKISKVSKDTGISRTTLTALYYGIGKGFQFDTLNTLCVYLDADINEIIGFLPFDLHVKNIIYCGMQSQTVPEEKIMCRAEMCYTDRREKNSIFYVNLPITLYKNTDLECAYRIEVEVVPEDKNQILSPNKNLSVADVFNQLGYEGERAVGDSIFQKLLDDIFISVDYDFAPLLKDLQYNIEFVLGE